MYSISFKKRNQLNPRFVCTFSLKGNVNTLKSEMICSHEVNLSIPNSIAPVLGFADVKYAPNILYFSSIPVNILKVNAIRIICNLVVQSYDNGVASHIIHEFFPSVPPGYKIVEIPRNVMYLPINTSTIRNITVKIVDENDKLVNFQGETITLRLHLKKVENNGY